jgi:3'(2'), 5'-bisphosphate nucleotidase
MESRQDSTARDRARLLDELTGIASRAAAAILSVPSPGATQRSKPDQSPVTAADAASEALILEALARLLPGVPVISEEACAHGTPEAPGGTFVLVDPLDGTRELLAGEREYAINIALIENGAPALGLIAAPALSMIWCGSVGHGAERLELAAGAAPNEARTRTAICTRTRPDHGAVALVSRFHRDPATDAYLDRLPEVRRLVVGSSLKFCRIAEGAADLYPRLSPMSEWDIAAGHALIAAAGGIMTALDGSALPYGRPNVPVAGFIAQGDPAPLRT